MSTALALQSCSSDQDLPDEVTVAFSGMGCESACPFMAVKVDTALSIGYFGGKYAAREGYYEGQLPPTLFDSVQLRFARFLHEGPVTPYGMTDHPDVEFYVRNGDVVNHYRGNTGHLTEEDVRLLYWFVGLVEQAEDLRPRDHILFETRYQTEPDFLRHEIDGSTLP